jgi:hypothetical protein
MSIFNIYFTDNCCCKPEAPRHSFSRTSCLFLITLLPSLIRWYTSSRSRLDLTHKANRYRPQVMENTGPVWTSNQMEDTASRLSRQTHQTCWPVSPSLAPVLISTSELTSPAARLPGWLFYLHSIWLGAAGIQIHGPHRDENKRAN